MEPGMSEEFAFKALKRLETIFSQRKFDLAHIGGTDRYRVYEVESKRALAVGYIPADVRDEIIHR